MKTVSSVVKPPSIDVAVRRYLMRDTLGSVPYPSGTRAVGKYQLRDQGITIYWEDNELAFNLGNLGHTSVDIEVRNTLLQLESYLRRVEYLKHDEQAVLRYTKYWD